MPDQKAISGMLLLVLHAHLPFVRHPEFSDSLEERWLYEAITETYLPLLEVFERLETEGLPFRLTLTMTPPLCAMLSDPLLQKRYIRHIEELTELAEKEVQRTLYSSELNESAAMYLEKFKKARYLFEKVYYRDLVSAFRKFQDSGRIEIITSSATHAFLPLQAGYPNIVRAQIQTAVKDYRMRFGRKASGIWNAECAYYPGLEKYLSEGDLRYFFVDTHGILHADQFPNYGVFAPMETGNKIAFFGRDAETSRTVWSSADGYPGDPEYREYYRDIGFDLDKEYIAPYIDKSGLRISTGIKYYRITGRDVPLESKEPYNPQSAVRKAGEHAAHFVEGRLKQIREISVHMDRKPVIVSLYDAELFGHWWYEGPEFIYQVLKIIAGKSEIATVTAIDYLELYPENQQASPPESSWGFKGYSEFWLNGSNDWIYPHYHIMNERMILLANQYRNTRSHSLTRALNQAARELMLAESSDWAFIMRTNTMVDYAVKRVKDHIGRFNKIYSMISGKKPMDPSLPEMEYRDNIFPRIDFRDFADPNPG